MPILGSVLSLSVVFGLPALLILGGTGQSAAFFWDNVFFVALTVGFAAIGMALHDRAPVQWRGHYYLTVAAVFCFALAVLVLLPQMPTAAKWPIAAFLSLYVAGAAGTLTMGVALLSGGLNHHQNQDPAPNSSPAPADDADLTYDPNRFAK